MTEAYHLLQQGLDSLRTGQSREAVEPLERALELQPDASSIREALGRTYFQLRRYEQAAAEFRTIIDAEPLEDYAHFCLGRAHERLGNESLALRHYRLAMTLRPDLELYERALTRFERNRGIGNEHRDDDPMADEPSD